MAQTNSPDQNQQFLSETEKLLELDAAQLSNGHRQPALDHLEKVRKLQEPSAELTSKCKQLFERLRETEPDRITQLVALGEKAGCTIEPNLLEQLRGLPEAPIFCHVVGKAPKERGWNQAQKLLTPEQLVSKKPSFRADGIGMVSGRISGFLFVDKDSKEECPDRSEQTFTNITGFSFTDLPDTPERISGKPHRWQRVFRVPPEWHLALSGYSWNDGDLELRWEDANGAAKQSVIGGQHPDHQDWKFRWSDGKSPADLQIADAPLWLLQTMLRHKSIDAGIEEGKKDSGGIGGRSADEPGPMDLLPPRKQRVLLQYFSKHWPYRGGEAGSRYQASYESDSFRGLLGALNNVLGPDIAEQWLGNTEWFSKNEDWACGKDFRTALQSIGNSKSENKAGWGTLHHLATRTEDSQSNRLEGPPAVLPPWARPPREVDVDKTALEAQTMADNVFAAREQINQLECPTARKAGLIRLKEDLGIRSEKEFSQLMRLAAQEKNPTQLPTSPSEILALNLESRQLVENLLPSGALTLLAAEGGVGKSSFLYRMAQALTKGEVFADGFKTTQSRVLFCQSDENVLNTSKKWTRMGWKPDDDSMQMIWDFSSAMLPDLERRVVAEKWDVVMMDSLFKIVSGEGLCMNDPQVADFLYDLNGMAGRTGCAVLLTHHANKPADRKNKGTRALTRNDVFGSVYFFNATSQCLLLWRDEKDRMKLGIEKDRDDSLGEGTVLDFTGSPEDYGWHLDGLQGSLMNLDQIQGAEAKVLALLKNVTSEEAMSPMDVSAELNRLRRAKSKVPETASIGEQINAMHDRQRAGAYSQDHVRKVCAKLHDTGKLRRRRLTEGGRGRPSYVYFNKV